MIVGIPGLNPGTMNALGSYIAWAKYSMSLRPGSRVFARTADSGEVGEPERSALTHRWQVKQSPLPSMISRPTLTMSAVVRSVFSTISAGGCTSFWGTIWPTYV